MKENIVELKHRFTLTLRMTNMIWVTGKLPSMIKQISPAIFYVNGKIANFSLSHSVSQEL